MKLFILFSILATLLLAKFGSSVPVISELKESPNKYEEFTGKMLYKIYSAWKEWSDWKSLHKKKYESISEEFNRFKVWLDNLEIIKNHNLENTKKHTLAMNGFGDLTHEEFTNMYLKNGHKMTYSGKGIKYTPPLNVYSNSLPKMVNWVNEGFVTDVKNQGQCGSCWSFSATGAIEGQLFKHTSNLISLSEQNLIDCSSVYGNQACDGGLMDYAFEYIIANGGIDTEDSYPYEGVLKTCRYDKQNRAVGVSDYVDIDSGNETQLMIAVATVGPISIAIDASHQNFQFYKSGIYDDDKCSSKQLDHGVLAVGYGVADNGDQYWLVKNSWGIYWGDMGYVKIAKNEDNMCGVATVASYPIIKL